MSWRIRIPIRDKVDRRSADRLVLRADVDIDAKTHQIKGEVRDISIKGLRIHLPVSVDVGQQLSIYLRLPGRDREEGIIKIHSEVRWCRKVADNEYMIGLSYLQIEPEEQEKLILLVSELMLNWIMSAQEGLIDNES